MKKITPFNNKKKAESHPLNTEPPQAPASSNDILQDPDYLLLLAESQQGHWNGCRQLIAILDAKYPGNSIIAEFKSDFELQATIIKDIESSTREEKKNTIIHQLKLLALIAGSIIAAYFIISFMSKKITSLNQEKQIQSNAYQINILSEQVEYLLNSGQPEKAQDLIEQMIAIDPTSPKINELSQKKDEILRINTLYLDAIDKLDNGLNSDALSALLIIQSEYPGYKDVSQLIESTSSKITLAQALSTGIEAFNAGNWQATIDNFEQVLALDTANTDSDLKRMLVSSYLHMVMQLLGNNDTTFSEINQAELYFSRAIKMIPQVKDNSSEQENLKQACANLLELKYTEAAHQLVNDPAQTMDSVALGFNYLNKALSLDPQNTSLQAEVFKLQLYNSGFHYYIEMNWSAAIQQLSALAAVDAGYPNGFARQLLYEAHTSQGIQYYSVNSPLDARKEYEIAETLASGSDNLLNYYLAEINLGVTLGKLDQFEDANFHFNNAIQTINYETRAAASPTLISDLYAAIALYQAGQYENSYNLFYKTLVGNETFYEMKKINAVQGNCLALIAALNRSSVQAILEQNDLPPQSVVATDQQLVIPTLP